MKNQRQGIALFVMADPEAVDVAAGAHADFATPDLQAEPQQTVECLAKVEEDGEVWPSNSKLVLPKAFSASRKGLSRRQTQEQQDLQHEVRMDTRAGCACKSSRY